jgi:3-hydroxymyristoyl/3-hydroxydecanoyl-(acyl carrier protein) dehydratase
VTVSASTQVGQAALLPRIILTSSNKSESVYRLDIDAALGCFIGHFPGRPVLAGIVQVHWAVLLARSCFGFERVPREIKRLKFKNLVVPPAVLELSLARVAETDVDFAYGSAGERCSEGRLIFPSSAQ